MLNFYRVDYIIILNSNEITHVISSPVVYMTTEEAIIIRGQKTTAQAKERRYIIDDGHLISIDRIADIWYMLQEV